MDNFVIAVLLITFSVEAFLKVLNERIKSQPIPENVSDIFDEKRYQKWIAYTKVNSRFGWISRGVSLAITLALLLFDGALIQVIYEAASISDSALLSVLLFLGIYQLIQFILGLGFSYYRTFKIETDFGFNKTTKKTFVSDKVKQLLLTIILGGGLVTGLYYLYEAFQDNLLVFIVIAWASLMAIFALISYLYTAVFVKIFNKIEPLEDGSLKTSIENLAAEIGFKVKAISKMDASKRSTRLNAFFSGFGKQKEIVLFDTLIDKMSEDEILAVLAHEFAHGKHKDVPRMFIQQAIQIFLYVFLFYVVLTTESLYTAFGFERIFLGFGVILFSILISPLDLLISLPTMALSRWAEYRADAYSVSLLGPEPMERALRKLAKESLSDLNPHPAYTTVYYSHPPMHKRLAAISKNASA